MKKLTGLLLTLLLVMSCFGCSSSKKNISSQEEKQVYSLYLDVTFNENLFFSRYDVDVVLDDEEIVSLKHGTNFTKIIEVTEGEHQLYFYKASDRDVKGSTPITIKEDATFSCTITTHGDDIEIADKTMKVGLEGSQLTMIDCEGMNLTLAVKELEKIGFSNIHYTASNDDTIIDTDNWIILAQNCEAGTVMDKNDKVTLTCMKTHNYLVDAVGGLSLKEARMKLQEISYTIENYINANTDASLTNDLQEEDDEVDGVWIVSDIQEVSANKKTANLYLSYIGNVAMINVKGKTLDQALELLNKAQLYNIEYEAVSDDIIIEKANWEVTSQSVAPGTIISADTEITMKCKHLTEESSSQIEKKSSSKKSIASQKNTYKIGDKLSVGKVRYKVTQVTTSNRAGNKYLNTKAQGRYLIVTIQITNKGDDPLNVSDDYFTLINGNKTYEVDSTAGFYLKNSIINETVNPDVTLKGRIAFDVSKKVASSKKNKLQVQTGFWGTEKGIIELRK